jgi:hypothetical protein
VRCPPRGEPNRGKQLIPSPACRPSHRVLEQVKKEHAAELLGFQDFDAYLHASIGETETESVKKFEAKATKQGERNDIGTVPKLQTDRAHANGLGMRTQRYLDRLARDHPALLEKVNAGELKPKTAARQAGIIRVPTRLENAKKAFLKLSPKEVKQLDAWREGGAA